MNLAERADELPTTNTNAAQGSRERFDVVVIGAGQAGLAAEWAESAKSTVPTNRPVT